MEKIRCSVGILTYNSGKNLRRALESVKNFSNIIIADGGSTDDTLQIAAEYGAARDRSIHETSQRSEPTSSVG
jgi:glycosyltransferase involved in cell wall biosynthesis